MLKLAATLCALAFGLFQGLKLAHYVVRAKKLRQQTGVPDLELLGESRKDSKKLDGTVVICGGSISGLAAARVCHDHFENVIIVEPEGWLSTEDAWADTMLEKKHKRSRLMQWDSYQGIQVWTTNFLSKLFPNFSRECAASCIPVTPGDVKFHFSGVKTIAPFRKYKGQLPCIMHTTRPCLETFLRRLVIGRKHYPNIKQIHGTVTGFEKDSENPTYLSKVLVRLPDNKTLTIPAALIIDCTGLTKAGTKILRRMGFGTLDCSNSKNSLDDLPMKFDQAMCYSTFSMTVTDDQIQRFPEQCRGTGPFGVYFPDSKAPERRVFLGQRTERNNVQLCCGQWGTAELPTNLNDYEVYAKSLNYKTPVPDFWYAFINILKETEEKATIKAVRIPPSSYIPFHRAVNIPCNWIAVGDSVMHLNPIFGQGITKASLGIVSLNTLLHEVHGGSLPQNFAQKFFQMQADKIEPIWQGVKGVDYNFDTTKPLPGETLSTGWGIRWYARQVQILATKDEHVGSVVWHVRAFLAPPFDFVHPDVVLKVLLEIIKRVLTR